MHRMTAGRLRVLQIVPVLRIGGLERVATTLCLELNGRIERVAVASMGGDPFEPVLTAAGVPVIHIPRPRPQPKRLVTSSVAIARALRRERPHLVHAHNPAAAICAAIGRTLAGMRRVPIVTTYHGVLPERIGRAAQAMESVSDAVVGVGPTSTAALLHGGLRTDRAHTIHNAVEVAPRRSAAEIRAELGVGDAELVVSVGRHAPEKNQALLVDAVAQLAHTRPRLRLVLVGEGWPHDEEELRRHIAAAGAESIVLLTGQRSDAVDLTAAADVFALSSDSEGLPLVLLEALAVGTPIVSTDAGGVRDVITDGETGLLVPVGDRGALASAIERLLEDDELRRGLAEHGRAFVERTCSARAMADAYLEIYLDVVRKRATA